jgi:hypothetical protein
VIHAPAAVLDWGVAADILAVSADEVRLNGAALRPVGVLGDVNPKPAPL